MIESTQISDAAANVKSGAEPLAPLESACARLKAGGLRITAPRRAILAALLSRSEPASIEQIHSQLVAGQCDLVTVYRCMAAFEEIGLVRRGYFLDGACLYEIDAGKPVRYHVVCRRTRRVHTIDSGASPELAAALHRVEETLRAQGFTEVGHVVEFFGTAPVSGAEAG
jgi:Fur family ferric uptake transcriptional regulator